MLLSLWTILMRNTHQFEVYFSEFSIFALWKQLIKEGNLQKRKDRNNFVRNPRRNQIYLKMYSNFQKIT